MRPSTISLLIAGVLVGLAAGVLGLLAFVDSEGGKPWFYWIAPLLAIGFLGIMAQLVVQYWAKIGKLEVKGRPRR